VIGRRIVQSAWATTVVYALVTVPAALGVDSLDGAEIAVSLALFAISIPVWWYAFGLAVVRTTRGDYVVVASLFFLQGSAPKPVQRQLFAALAVNLVVVAATAVANPFGVLVPMLPLGLIGLWGARHGTFPPRPTG
jgi:fatty acid desaturase